MAASNPFGALFGDTLAKNVGGETVPTATALEGKIVGIYFSAHWCPPCRRFTPELVKTYNLLKESGKPFEIVFVSSDKSDHEFKEYYGSMPWLALPYSDRDRKAKLSGRYKVSGIPTLVILDANGKTINAKAREAVGSDPKGNSFPWSPPTLDSVLGSEFLKSSSGEKVGRAAIENKFIGFYFSAHWCPPCRAFTPELVKTYQKVKASGRADNFDIVFVSGDNDEKSFKEYFAEMPWLAVPFDDEDRRTKLNQFFEVEGIPTFVMLDLTVPGGRIINRDARGSVGADPEGAEFPWHPRPVNDLNENPAGINDAPALVVLLEHVDEGRKAAIKADVETVAREHSAAPAGGEEEEGATKPIFFTASEGGNVSSQIRKITGQPAVPGPEPIMILLDISDSGAYYKAEGTIDAASIRAFLAAYKGKTLTRQQMQRS